MLDQCFPYSRISSNAIKRFKLHTTNIKGEEVVTVVIKTKTPPTTDIRDALRVYPRLLITTQKRSFHALVIKYFPSMDLAHPHLVVVRRKGEFCDKRGNRRVSIFSV